MNKSQVHSSKVVGIAVALVLSAVQFAVLRHASDNQQSYYGPEGVEVAQVLDAGAGRNG